ncbi:MAG: PilZ domain-containing protein [Candidatus Omnitrophica bacterium]|nr:PilZ domain-containing protein [Candidatus Omnitrophota bacterium]
MNADVLHKTIGQVQILDLLGDFKGTLASRCLLNVQQRFTQQTNPYAVMLTTQHLGSIDKQGAKAILASLRGAEKCAVITRDTFAAELLLENPEKKICIFENSEDGIFYLRNELIQDYEENEFSEKRKYPRLPVALPVKTNVLFKDQKRISLLMVATNLTFTGLFAKFIDTQSEIEVRKNINLYDLPLLDFKIRLSYRDFITVKGKIIHMDPRAQGMGVEFYEMTEPSEWLLKRFLDAMIAGESGSNSDRIVEGNES